MFKFFNILILRKCLNRYYNITSDININNCFFNFFISNQNGGAIYILEVNYNFFINYCIFDSCFVNNGNGGAIFIQSIIHKKKFNFFFNCGYNCSTNDSFNQQYLGFSGSNKSISSIDYNSIFKCPGQIHSGGHSFLISHGVIEIKYLNISNCYLYYNSGITSGSAIILNIKLSNLKSNIDLNGRNCHIQGLNSTFSFSNFFNNSCLQGINRSGEGLLVLDNLIFKSNFFYYNEFLLILEGSYIIVKNCYSDTFLFTGFNSITFISTNYSIPSTFNINLYSTYKCEGNFIKNSFLNLRNKLNQIYFFTFIFLCN